MAKIRVLIPLGGNGKVTTTGIGFPGNKCQKFVDAVTARVGGEVTQSEPVQAEEETQEVVLEGAG